MKKLNLFIILTFLGCATTSLTAQNFNEILKAGASDAASGDLLGYSVHISGNRAIVGAAFKDDGGNSSGSAYLFELIGSTWTEMQKIDASDAAASDNFGRSVSISGNYAVIGASGNDDAGSNSGSAYVFELVAGTWTQMQKITASDAASGDNYGQSVSISGTTIAVGAYGNDDAGNSSGSVYIYDLTGTWSETQILTASDATADDSFGYHLYLDGTKLIIGAWGKSSDAGSAYIFDMSGSWSETQQITASDASGNDRFGWSVCIDGNRAIIGAHQNADAGTNSGSAYIFDLGGTWTETQKLLASDAASQDKFGMSVSISGSRALIGAPNNDDAGSNSGSAYLFDLSGTWSQTQKLVASDAATSDNFGNPVCIVGDKMTISAPYNDDAGSSSGNVYFFSSTIVGIDDYNSLIDFKIYPNPVKDYLTIDLLTSEENATVQIYNITGKLVLSQDIKNSENQLNTSTLSNGIYSLTVTTNTSWATKKIVIAK